MPHYLVYGLTLESERAVPGLVARASSVEATPDVRLFWQQLPAIAPPSEGDWSERYVSPNCGSSGEPTLRAWQRTDGEYFWLRYSDRTEFAIDRQGQQIWACWSAPLTLEDTAIYLLGPVLGFVLRLRGVTCLHASAAIVRGRAIAFLGPPGAGKSTLAAAFAREGYSVLTDDIATLKAEKGRFSLRPGYPYLRLWAASAIALFGRAEALPRLVPTHPTWDKRYLDLRPSPAGFPSENIPLGQVYLLAKRENAPQRPRIERISPQAAMMAFVANTYTTYLLDRAMRAAEFATLSQLTRSHSLRQILPQADPAGIPASIEQILKDIEW